MTIHLPNDLESSIQAAVHAGRFASVDAAMAVAARLLLQTIKQNPQAATAGEGRPPLRFDAGCTPMNWTKSLPTR